MAAIFDCLSFLAYRDNRQSAVVLEVTFHPYSLLKTKGSPLDYLSFWRSLLPGVGFEPILAALGSRTHFVTH